MKGYQQQLDRLFKKHGWRYWSAHGILAALVEEVGEVARLINHLYGEKPKKSTEKKQELEEELGDVIYTLLCLANKEKINLDQAIQKSLKKSFSRDKNRFN